MPPRNRTSTSQTTAFGRTHPNLQRILLLSCEAGPFLMIATIATGAGVWRRPLWQRSMLWRAALWSFLARWVLVGCAVTWSWNEWGGAEEDGEGGDRGRGERPQETERRGSSQGWARVRESAQREVERSRRNVEGMDGEAATMVSGAENEAGDEMPNLAAAGVADGPEVTDSGAHQEKGETESGS